MRTGERGGRWEVEDIRMETSSRDNTINGEGKKLLEWLSETELVIVNGTKGVGDYTYLGPRGFTVIDYVLVNEIEGENKGDKELKAIAESDHLRTTCSLKEK